MVEGRRGPAAGWKQGKGSTAVGAVDPAYQRAILKIAIELRKPGAKSYDDVVEGTIQAMRLDAGAFRKYLGENGARNMSLLLATARAAGI